MLGLHSNTLSSSSSSCSSSAVTASSTRQCTTAMSAISFLRWLLTANSLVNKAAAVATTSSLYLIPSSLPEQTVDALYDVTCESLPILIRPAIPSVSDYSSTSTVTAYIALCACLVLVCIATAIFVMRNRTSGESGLTRLHDYHCSWYYVVLCLRNLHSGISAHFD